MNKQVTTQKAYVKKWLAMPILFLLVWFSLSIIYLASSDFSFTVLSFNHNGEKQATPQDNPNGTNREWTGHFISKENYLGIVSIVFDKTDKPVFDKLSFMIRERGESEWYETNTYDSRQFYYLNNFPFGFKTIKDSKNKIYEYKFVSQTGGNEYTEAFEKLNPIVVSKYQYPKEILLSDPLLLIAFLVQKIFFALTIPSYRNTIIFYALPFIVYFCSIIIFKKTLVSNKTFIQFKKKLPALLKKEGLQISKNKFFLLFTVLLLLDIFVIGQIYDVLTCILLLYWLILVFSLKLRSNYSFLLALLLTTFIPIALLIKNDVLLKKIADWIYYMLLFGNLQGMIELSFVPKKIQTKKYYL